MISKRPIRFRPYLKTVIWGGNRICDFKGMDQTEPNVGESWEISAIPGHESVVEEGPYEGLKITELIGRYGKSLLGDEVYERFGANFPLLIKLIDANDNLSVQVHPNDQLAMERHGSRGKTEMWYIISSDDDARIYSGLRKALTPEEYERRVDEGSLMEVLATHSAQPGDVFFLPAGRIHAIGAGNLLAEIQESSDITYRIYDYGRRDKDGKTRELHTELAKDAIDFNVYQQYKTPAPHDDDTMGLLASCEHFTTHRLLLDGERDLQLDGHSFTVIMCVKGAATLSYPSGEMTMHEGQTLLVPAALSYLYLAGHATLLLSRC